jgi:hypothetical protein
MKTNLEALMKPHNPALHLTRLNIGHVPFSFHRSPFSPAVQVSSPFGKEKEDDKGQ